MSADSTVFLMVALLGAAIYNVNPSLVWRQAALLAVNAFFLTTFSHNPRQFIPLFVFLAAGYGGVRLMQAGGTRWFAPATALLVALLVWLKKYSFLPQASFLQGVYVAVGLSYICFRMLHLLAEAKDGNVQTVSPVAYVNYTLNFLTFVSGPIQIYAEYAQSQLRPQRPQLGLASAAAAVERVAVGVFKVSLLSLLFQSLHERGMAELASTADPSGQVPAGILAAAAYPIFLYMNFSGYMDIVIGVGRFYRFALPENFDRPFLAPNFLMFWNRWHMTLSNFFKVYVFNPLLMAMMRRIHDKNAEPLLVVLAYFFTFVLLGFWHGQTSVFAVYGLVLGLGVSLNKLYQLMVVRRLGAKGYKALAAGSLYTALCRGFTFTYFTFSLLFFWSDWPQMHGWLDRLGAVSLVTIWVGVFLGATATLAAIALLVRGMDAWRMGAEPVLESRYVRTAVTTAVIVITVAATALLNAPAPENIYKAF